VDHKRTRVVSSELKFYDYAQTFRPVGLASDNSSASALTINLWEEIWRRGMAGIVFFNWDLFSQGSLYEGHGHFCGDTVM
jgi:hypothetical protein